MRKMFLEDLPKWKYGTSKNKIDWSNSKGSVVRFIYNDIESEVRIIDYDQEKDSLSIQYLDEDIFQINTSNFRDCRLGKFLGKITDVFRLEVGNCIKDEKRDLTIIDKEYRVKHITSRNKNHNQKWYKYICNKCKHKNWVIEHSLLKGYGCPCCANKIAVLGINTIWDTDKWMCGLGVSKKDAKKFINQSKEKIEVKCPHCGMIKKTAIYYIYGTKSIGCVCGDGYSYGEKLVTSLLEQLNIDYINQLSKTSLEWCERYRYDFHLPKHNTIIEVHGEQHYKDKNMGGRTLLEEQKNDKLKKELALQNGISHYIIIDCRKSELEWIKNSILNSRLNKLFDLSKTDWLKCEEFALSNRVKEVCEYKKNNPELSTTEISYIFKLNVTSILTYLKKGSKLGWCEYNPILEKSKASRKAGKKTGKKIEIFKDGNSLGVFKSLQELFEQSENIFNIKFSKGNISRVCNNRQSEHKGYTFKYVDEKGDAKVEV